MFKLLVVGLLLVSVPCLAGSGWEMWIDEPEPVEEDRGVYIGNTSTNVFDPRYQDSIHNPVGRYGSEISPDSIHNPMHPYNDVTNPASPSNPLTSPGVDLYMIDD